MTANGHEVSFKSDENVLKFIMLMVAELCDYIKAIQLYTLNRQIIWCVNYLSRKMLFKKITTVIFCWF